jgi:hypothetical protein
VFSPWAARSVKVKVPETETGELGCEKDDPTSLVRLPPVCAKCSVQPELKRLWREAHHSPPYCTQVKNERMCTSAGPRGFIPCTGTAYCISLTLSNFCLRLIYLYYVASNCGITN